MEKNIKNLALEWVTNTPEFAKNIEPEYYCQTRDVFQARLDKTTLQLLQKKDISENTIYLISAISGEIGNNSFDHNLGNWPDMPGIFFGCEFSAQNNIIILADRGQGILATLKKVRPELTDDTRAVEIAFKEKISGRAPENRGNGLKFVRQSIQERNLHLTFFSGSAQAKLNAAMHITKTDHTIRGCLAILTF